LAADSPAAALPVSTVLAALAGISSAWIAAGTVGLLAEPLRVVLTWIGLLLTAMALPSPRRLLGWRTLGPLLLLVLPLAVPVSPIHEVLLVAATLAMFAAGQSGSAKTVLAICARATLVLGVFRLVCASIPAAWLLGDSVAAAVGHGVAWLTDKRLEIGMSFAGVDYLVFMAAFVGNVARESALSGSISVADARVSAATRQRSVISWFRGKAGLRVRRAGYAMFAVAGAHFVYLVLLAVSVDWLQRLPAAPEPAFVHPYIPVAVHWSTTVRQLVPWNAPLVAGLLHLAMAGLMLRWTRWPVMAAAPVAQPAAEGEASRLRYGRAARWAVWGLPVAAALAAAWCSGSTDLSGKRLLANRNGLLDWRKPVPDQYGKQAAGMLGMLPTLVRSLGGSLTLTDDFTSAELHSADAVLVIHPSIPTSQTTPLAAATQDGEPVAAGLTAAQIQRILDYVRQGGSLLVVGGPFQYAPSAESAENRLLSATQVAVRRDVAVPATPRWQQTAHASWYFPQTDIRSGYVLSDWGASLAVGWRACPLAVGRWGWSDPGSDAVLTGQCRLEPGERLGDLVLAAEQRYGGGRIVVIGDDLPLTNEGLVRGFHWTARLLGYLVHHPPGPQAEWRQVTACVLCLCLLAMVLLSGMRKLLPIALLLAVSLPTWGWLSQRSSEAVPDGQLIAGDEPARRSRLAYIGASNLEAFSDADWGLDGINGLALALMRQGYLALALPDLDSQHLERAALLVTIAPARPFTRRERERIVRFVTRGGVWICAAGAEDVAGSRALLAEFGMQVPASPVPAAKVVREPEPMGRFRATYGATGLGAQPGVRFHAGWPVVAKPPAEIWVTGNRGQPIVLARRAGRGTVVLIGDTGFALNKNLEYINGEPLDGQYENALFWRWLLERVGGGQPSAPRGPGEKTAAVTGSAATPGPAGRPDP